MPALRRTGYQAEIVWLGIVPQGQMQSVAVDRMELDFEGPLGEAHRGYTRASCSRVTGQFAKGTEIANTRQLSILSAHWCEISTPDGRRGWIPARYLAPETS